MARGMRILCMTVLDLPLMGSFILVTRCQEGDIDSGAILISNESFLQDIFALASGDGAAASCCGSCCELVLWAGSSAGHASCPAGQCASSRWQRYSARPPS